MTQPAMGDGADSCGAWLAHHVHKVPGELAVWSTMIPPLEEAMTWTKPEFEVVELGMEVGAYAGNA